MKEKIKMMGLMVLFLTMIWTLISCDEESHYLRNEALHVKMSDGVRIAVDVWLPENLSKDEKVPALVQGTRYWRACEVVDAAAEDVNLEEADRLNAMGYAYIIFDVRGTGASFGSRPIPWSPDEVADFGELVYWIESQPWSNGVVGTTGISYDGVVADLFSVHNKKSVRAVQPQFSDYDLYTDHIPGGLLSTHFIKAWSDMNRLLDANDLCGAFELSGQACDDTLKVLSGVKQVDSDANGTLLKQAVGEHEKNVDVFKAVSEIVFRDDVFSTFTLDDASPFSYQSQMEEGGTAYFAWGSWIDANTANGVLRRFMSQNSPQKVIIGPWAHGEPDDNRDPFYYPHGVPPESDESDILDDAFHEFLQGTQSPLTIIPEIRYYTLNEAVWRSTSVWPPEGIVNEKWYFESAQKLGRSAPISDNDSDTYKVDFTATSGTETRWSTQMGGDVKYDDRSKEDEKLLTYTSDILLEDMRITGHPVITLHITFTHDDGALIVYLEDVAPDGRVTYVSEGELRVIHRKVSDEPPPYTVFGPYHTFEAKDGMTLTPGQTETITFSLMPTSVLFKAGHRIRVAIAGADAGAFPRIPADGDPTLQVMRSRAYPSHIMLPTAEK